MQRAAQRASRKRRRSYFERVNSIMMMLEEAKARLQRSIELNKDIRRLALDDEDLKPLWDWIGGLK